MNVVDFPASRAAPPVPAPRDRLEQAAEQFEALFLQQLLKQMRKASDVLSAESPLRSRQLDSLRSYHDEALAQTLASRRETGIARLLVAQLGGDPVAPPVAAPTVWQRGIAAFSPPKTAPQGLSLLVERVIAHESAGQVAAVSTKGARGLMQLMPETARQMAEQLNLPYSEARLTRDAAYNRRLGSAYLSGLLERYHGEPALALAAYNAGPGRVDSWLQANGDPRRGPIDVATWVERIPFAETRDYTRAILAELPEAGRFSSTALRRESFKEHLS